VLKTWNKCENPDPTKYPEDKFEAVAIGINDKDCPEDPRYGKYTCCMSRKVEGVPWFISMHRP